MSVGAVFTQHRPEKRSYPLVITFVASSDGTIKLWDILLGRLIHSFEEEDESYDVVRFCSNDQYIVTTASGYIYLFK